MRDIVISDRGVEAAHDAGAISSLLSILDSADTKSKDVVSTSVLILSKMIGCYNEMDNTDAITSLCRVGDYLLSDEALIALAEFFSKYSKYLWWNLRTWPSDGTFPQANPVPLFFRLLSVACTEV
jgi:hypothetical protein